MSSDYYKQMQDGTFQDPVYMSFTSPNFAFYQFQVHYGTRDATGADLTDFDKMKGDWKFHMSVHPDDVPKAWDIVVEEMLQQNHAMLAKVVKPEKIAAFSNPDSVQAGKHITVYTYKDLPPQLYMNLIQKLETKLDEAGVRAGPESNADRIIAGGKYTSYRLESGPNGEYVASVDLAHLPREQRYNPWNTPDPYADFKMTTVPTPDPSAIHPAIMDAGVWQDGITQSGEMITRIPVRGMDDKSVRRITDDLEKLGIKPVLHESSSLGKTIRLRGDDVGKLRDLQQNGMRMEPETPQVKGIFARAVSSGLNLFGKKDAPQPHRPNHKNNLHR